MPAYAELQAATNFSFLRGASHAQELVERACDLGLAALGVADRNTMAGMVRAHVAAKGTGLQLVVGCRLVLRDGPDLLCWPRDREAYGRLCRLLTRGQLRAGKGECDLALADVYEFARGQIFAVAPPPGLPERLTQNSGGQPSPPSGHPTRVHFMGGRERQRAGDASEKSVKRTFRSDTEDSFAARLEEIAANLPERPFLIAHHLFAGYDRRRLAMLAALAARTRTPLLAANDVHYHAPERRPLTDVLTAIREKCTVAEAGFRLAANAERHLKSPAEMARLFHGYGAALARTVEVADACRFSLDELKYEYPDEPVPPGLTPQAHLEALTWEGAGRRYPQGVPGKVRATLAKELKLIAGLQYAPYFLTVHDIVQYARSVNILCQGRGSAANSAVCYCLGITAVDPEEVDLLFERFVSAERGEPPDIDVDFEHERREEVIQYIYRRYGRARAGIAATVISYRARSAVRDVGKAMGLTADVTGALAGTVWGGHGGIDEERVREAGLNPADPHLRRTLELAHELMGFPRHLSQHVGGFVLTRRPLDEVVPIGNAAMPDRTFVEWDKDDLDALGILKVDVLGLGMLTCIRKCFELLEAHYGRKLTLATVPKEDPAVYDMLCAADSLGVFQVESRAQMNMLPRLKPRTFYDLVIEVAIVRPGPIQGDMVHPYLRRRAGLEPADFPSPDPAHGPPDELRRILSKTMGVPLFQEQAMRIAIEAAKFTPDEANQLRHAMATFRRRGTIDRMRGKFIERMVARGYERDFAERCFKQIEGFGEYGFPESHSASFSKLVYVSSWLKCHYPAVFACGLLNSQPMGFYAPAQIVRDARAHGVEVRPVDVNHSFWHNTLEPCAEGGAPRGGGFALRLGMRQAEGVSEEHAALVVAARHAPYEGAAGLHARTGLGTAALEKLAAADAFRSAGADRRKALWQVRGLVSAPDLPLFAHAGTGGEGPEPEAALPEMALSEHVVVDYQTLRLSLKAHPVSFLRDGFAAAGVASAETVRTLRDGARAAVAGVVLVRQRPGSAKGVVFLTLEDETGIVNCVVWPKVMERYRRVVMGSRLVFIRGRIQRHESIVHLMAMSLEDWTPQLARLADADAVPAGAADKPVPPGAPAPGPHRHPRNVRIIPRSRDFH